MGETPKLVSPARVFARPTADDIWLGPAQQAALSHLSRPAHARLIVGPTSCGKSMLLQHLASRLDPNAVVLQCRGPKDTAAGVLASLLLSADLGPWDLSEIEQRNLFTVFVQQRHSQKRRVLLLLDDADTFVGAALMELERLLAFKINKRPAIEFLIAGREYVPAQWRDAASRVDAGPVLVHDLPPPSPEDLLAYLEWRLARFNMREVMSPVALQMIGRISGGRYAAADVLCQMSLLVLRRLGLERADARVVRQAVAALAARQADKLAGDPPADASPLETPLPQGYVVISRSGKVLARAVLKERTLIGRSEDNDICLPSPYLSRHHAVIVGTPEGYYLVDLNSVNGVLLNGRKVDRTILCDDDVLALGPFKLKLQVPDGLAPTSPLPQVDSLADTATLPQPHPPPVDVAAMRRVK